jgi:hypothetical protein
MTTPFVRKIETLGALERNLQDGARYARELIGSGPIIFEIRRESRHRTWQQNKLQRKWCLEAEQQGDCTAEEYRGYCKLHFGVPILRAEDEEFAAKYEQYIRGLPYETKMALMMEPFDFPVTRLMDTDQKARYLNKVYEYFTGLGMRLTEPKKHKAA